MRRRALLAAPVLAAALVLPGCVAGGSGGSGEAGAVVETSGGGGPPNGTVTDKALPPSVIDVPLTDADGRMVRLRDLAGKTVVITTFLTTCQEVCPMTSVNIRDAADAVAKAGLGDSVRFLEVSVDPERDDTRHLAAYRALFGATRPDWTFLTGTPADVAAFWAGLGVAYSKTPDEPPLPKDWLTGKPLTYDVTHQDGVFLVDGRGHERWLVLGTPDSRGQAPPPTLNTYLNDEGRENLAHPPQPGWTAEDVTAAVAWWTHQPVR